MELSLGVSESWTVQAFGSTYLSITPHPSVLVSFKKTNRKALRYLEPKEKAAPEAVSERGANLPRENEVGSSSSSLQPHIEKRGEVWKSLGLSLVFQRVLVRRREQAFLKGGRGMKAT